MSEAAEANIVTLPDVKTPPDFMVHQKRWTIFKKIWNTIEQKYDKEICTPTGGIPYKGYPNPENPNDFAHYSDVKKVCDLDSAYIPAFYLLKKDRILFLDYDKKRDKPCEVPQFPTYTERSTNGGYHVFAWYDGEKPTITGVEVYQDRRWIIVTGDIVDGKRDINYITDSLKPQRKGNPKKFRLPENIPEGDRNTILHKFGSSLRAKGSSEIDIVTALLAENQNRCKPPLPDDEVRNIGKSVAGYPAGTPGEIYTQIVIADSFRDTYVDEWAYNIDQKKWFFWNGQYWQLDEKDQVKNVARDFLKGELAVILTMPVGRDVVTLTKFIVGLNTARGIRDILAIAAPGMTIKDRDLDTQPYLLNCLNGTLNLKTMEFREHQIEDYISKITGVKYDKEATCPRWVEHFKTIFDNEETLIKNIQEVLGYSLFLGNPDAVFLVFYGSGRNGKSVTIETLHHVLGSYSVSVSPSSMMEAGGNPGSDRIGMAGARLISALEPSDGIKGRCQLDTGFIKAATGNDPISARRLYCEGINFKIEGLFILASNSLPKIRDPSVAIWERIWMVPFNHYFQGNQRNHSIIDTLKNEGPGILNWLIQGFERYRAAGRLVQCDTIKAQTADYRHDEDFYSPFFDACTSREPGLSISSTDLYHKYENWFKLNFPGKNPATQNKFSRDMSVRFQRKKTDNVWHFQGIGDLGQKQLGNGAT